MCGATRAPFQKHYCPSHQHCKHAKAAVWDVGNIIHNSLIFWAPLAYTDLVVVNAAKKNWVEKTETADAVQMRPHVKS